MKPRTYFDSRPLAEAEKLRFGLPRDGFAGEVRRVDMIAEMLKSHQLRIGVPHRKRRGPARVCRVLQRLR